MSRHSRPSLHLQVAGLSPEAGAPTACLQTSFGLAARPSYATLPDGKKLATYNPQFIEIGRMAVQLAQRRLQQPLASPVHAAIQGHLVQGHTCKRPQRLQE